ncbi:hypothetical protein VTP01DRAFT_7716 [Rhizomucor pusillus]|uniref:uncharacterized protein n=1 Tax=Rhizomucor pusillus TaxID=4840 RepID=UPI0037449C41
MVIYYSDQQLHRRIKAAAACYDGIRHTTMDQFSKTIQDTTDRVVETLSNKQDLQRIGKIVSISVAAYFVTTKLYDAFLGPLSSLPGPFIGKFFRIRKYYLDHPLGTAWMKLRDYHKKYGRVVRLGPNYISVSDKDMLKQILVKDDLTKGPNYDLLAAAGNTQTMFNTRDKVFHKQRRRVVSPAFSMKYLGSLEPFMHQTTKAFVNKIDKDIKATQAADGYGTVNLWVLFQCLALDIIGETAFGRSFDMLENNEHFVPRTIGNNMKINHYLMSEPLMAGVTMKLQKRGLKSQRGRLQEFMKNIILERLQGGEKARRDDILQILIDTQHASSDEDRLTAEAIANETVLFLVAGSETTSNTSGFAVIELLRHPDKLEKLRREIDALPLEDGFVFKHEQLKHLPYLNAVINETLRKNWIAAAGLERFAQQDMVLGGKLFIPKGTRVICSIWNAQMDPEYWKNPEQFIPERWLDGAGDLSPELDAYYPFSAGSRNCIGKNFAIQEMRLSLAMLVRLYDLKAIPEEMEQAEHVRQYQTLQLESNSFKVLMKRRS